MQNSIFYQRDPKKEIQSRSPKFLAILFLLGFLLTQCSSLAQYPFISAAAKKKTPPSPSGTGSSTTNGAVLIASMDEGAGTTTTNLFGAAGSFGGTVPPTWTTGKKGGGLLMSQDGYVNFGQITAIEQNASLSVCVWFKPSTALTAEDETIAQKYSGSTARAFRLMRYYNEALVFEVRNSTPAVGLSGTIAGAAAHTNWMHVAGVYDGSVLKIYTNGVLAGTGDLLTGNVSSTSANVTAGKMAGSVNGFVGAIDDYRIYTNALSAARVLAIYHEGL